MAVSSDAGVLHVAGGETLAYLMLQRLMKRLGRPLRALRHGGSAALRIGELALAMPWPLWTVSADGAAIYRGRWRLAGEEVATQGRVVFDVASASSAWLEELHAFNWLFALLHGERPLWVLMARRLLRDWALRLRKRRLPAVAMHPAVLARRLINLTAAGPRLLAGDDEGFSAVYFQLLSLQMRALQRLDPASLPAAARLEVHMARAWCALAAGLDERARQQALAGLQRELRRQFLPDGGHVSRAPARQRDLLAVLLPLAKACERLGGAVPPALAAAVEKGLPMLRLWRHADGGIALFQGGRDVACKALKTLLDQDAVAGAPLEHAPHSGYARLAAGRAVLLADVGGPPPASDNPAAALSALAIEFSSHGQRIITSCGAPARPDPELDFAARTSAAHSMPVLGGLDAGAFHHSRIGRLLFGVPLARGPRVQAQVVRGREGLLLQARHDAWAENLGFAVSRKVFLSADGRELRGEDAFVPILEKGGRPTSFAIAFHLHPGITARLSRDGRSLMLRSADGGGWRFAIAEGTLALEESLFMAAPDKPRRCARIVISGTCPRQGTSVRWRLQRLRQEKKAAAHKRGGECRQSAPALPLA